VALAGVALAGARLGGAEEEDGARLQAGGGGAALPLAAALHL
jgi:hypothetical protein